MIPVAVVVLVAEVVILVVVEVVAVVVLVVVCGAAVEVVFIETDVDIFVLQHSLGGTSF